MADVASTLHALVPKRVANWRSVSQGLRDLQWIKDIKGTLIVPASEDYLQLWDALQNMELQQGVADTHV